MTAIEAAEQAGFDMSLIDESLRCSPEQRAIQHQAALEMALQLLAAFELTKRKSSDGTKSPAATTL